MSEFFWICNGCHKCVSRVGHADDPKHECPGCQDSECMLPHFIHGVDKEGNPTITMKQRVDMAGWARSTGIIMRGSKTE